MDVPGSELARKRCFNHPGREAVALCLECQRYFCRECITEHEDRVLCTSCLKNLARPPLLKRFRLAAVGGALQGLLGFLLIWTVLYLFAQTLLAIPSSFHEGTVWESTWEDVE